MAAMRPCGDGEEDKIVGRRKEGAGGTCKRLTPVRRLGAAIPKPQRAISLGPSVLPVRSVRAGGAPLGSPQTRSSLGPSVPLVRSVRARGELARWTGEHE